MLAHPVSTIHFCVQTRHKAASQCLRIETVRSQALQDRPTTFTKHVDSSGAAAPVLLLRMQDKTFAAVQSRLTFDVGYATFR